MAKFNRTKEHIIQFSSPTRRSLPKSKGGNLGEACNKNCYNLLKSSKEALSRSSCQGPSRSPPLPYVHNLLLKPSICPLSERNFSIVKTIGRRGRGRGGSRTLFQHPPVPSAVACGSYNLNPLERLVA